MITLAEIKATGLPLHEHDAIAAVLSQGRTKVVPIQIGVGTVLAVMAPVGGDFLNTLEQMSPVDSNVKWVLKLIEQGSFDVGHPVTRAQLQAFANAVPTLATGIHALLQVAVVSDDVSAYEVAITIERG